MRYVKRVALDSTLTKLLEKQQIELDNKCSKQPYASGNITKEWESASKPNLKTPIRSTLKSMMGVRERCMYCLDSHGTDIEHFWPKSPYPGRMYSWPNMLLCCAECGRLKGDRFPLDDSGNPMLIDPTSENPWSFLDFEPITGNIVAKFDIKENDWSSRGQETVKLLHLDSREAISAGCCRTLHVLRKKIKEYLEQSSSRSFHSLIKELREDDDYGLLDWCISGSGRNLSPFSEFKALHQPDWDAQQD